MIRQGKRTAAAAVAALGAVLTLSAPAGAAGALAVGKCGGYGTSWSQPTQIDARRVAFANCRAHGTEGCSVVTDFYNTCVAFAWDASQSCGATGWGRDSPRRAAEIIALRECSHAGGSNCVVRGWACD